MNKIALRIAFFVVFAVGGYLIVQHANPGLFVQGELEHVNGALRLTNEASTIEVIATNPANTDLDLTGPVIDLYRQALTRARRADAARLNKYYEGFGEHWRNEYIAGLDASIAGHDSRDRAQFARGQQLLEDWEAWYGANRSRFR